MLCGKTRQYFLVQIIYRCWRHCNDLSQQSYLSRVLIQGVAFGVGPEANTHQGCLCLDVAYKYGAHFQIEARSRNVGEGLTSLSFCLSFFLSVGHSFLLFPFVGLSFLSFPFLSLPFDFVSFPDVPQLFLPTVVSLTCRCYYVCGWTSFWAVSLVCVCASYSQV